MPIILAFRRANFILSFISIWLKWMMAKYRNENKKHTKKRSILVKIRNALTFSTGSAANDSRMCRRVLNNRCAIVPHSAVNYAWASAENTVESPLCLRTAHGPASDRNAGCIRNNRSMCWLALMIQTVWMAVYWGHPQSMTHLASNWWLLATVMGARIWWN